MSVWGRLWRPWFVYRPSQLIRRLKCVLSPAARLFWGPPVNLIDSFGGGVILTTNQEIDCKTFGEAKHRLEKTPIARPVIYTLVGCSKNERRVIERTKDGYLRFDSE